MRALIGVLTLLLVAPAASAFTVRDMLGHEVRLPAPPGRVISLVPSATEIIFALGGDGRLVGVTDFCDWPPAARAKPSVGGMVAPSLETIVALRPDVVVATDEGNSQETFDQLARLRIPLYVVRAHRLDDVRAVISGLGALTGRAATVPSLVEGLGARVRRVVDAVRARGRPRVLYVLWPEPVITPGRDSLVTELIDLAGGSSVTAMLGGAYPRLGLEAVVAEKPEVIVLARHGGDETPTLRATWARLASVPAIRAGRIQSVDGALVHRYGPRVADGLELLARAIHPEVTAVLAAPGGAARGR
jgi:iron complex transport system substrate-binding protein